MTDPAANGDPVVYHPSDNGDEWLYGVFQMFIDDGPGAGATRRITVYADPDEAARQRCNDKVVPAPLGVSGVTVRGLQRVPCYRGEPVLFRVGVTITTTFAAQPCSEGWLLVVVKGFTKTWSNPSRVLGAFRTGRPASPALALVRVQRRDQAFA